MNVIPDAIATWQRRHDRLQLILDKIPAAVSYWDQDQINRFANQAYLKLVGMPPAEIPGHSIREVLGEAFYSSVRVEVEAALRGEPQSFERRYTDSKGRPRCYRIRYIPDEQNGQVVGFCVLGQDVTRHQQVYDALKTSEANLAQAQRLAKIGSWSWELDSNELIWSEQLYRLFGLDPAQPPPAYAQQAAMFGAESWARLKATVADAVANGTAYLLDLEITRADGTTGWITARGEAGRDADGRIVRLFGSVQDITDRQMLALARSRELEQARALAEALQARSAAEGESAALRALVKQRDDMLAERDDMLQFLAHEVRQPLNNASAALQGASTVMAALESETASEGRSALVRAERVLGHVIGGLNNTLAAASMLVSGQEPAMSDTPLETLIGLVIHDISAADRPRVKVETLSAARTVRLQPSLMRLALFNVLTNALAYSPTSTPVLLRVADSDDPLGIVLEVLDRGSGIAPELLPHVFEKGRRGANARHKSGAGLGLFIVRQVINMHRGSIEMLPQAGGGTIVRITVPQGIGL